MSFTLLNKAHLKVYVMKPIKKPLSDSRLKDKTSSIDEQSKYKITLKLVTEEEREKYRVPSYGYIL